MSRFAVLPRRLAVILALAFPFAPTASFAEVDYTTCDLADTLLASQTIADAFHEFGSDTQTYPNEFSLLSLPFSQVFDLYVTNTVSERWSQAEWLDIIEAVMSPDTMSTSDDVFGVVWSYFTRDDADLNPSRAQVERASRG